MREACNSQEDVSVLVVDENAEFVLLGLVASGILIHLHLRSRTEKVFDEIKLLNMRNQTFKSFSLNDGLAAKLPSIEGRW